MANDSLPLIIGVTVPFVILCTTSFALRIHSRVWIAKSFGADDWMMVIAFFLWVGQQSMMYSWIWYGAGRHVSEVSDAEILTLKTSLLVEHFYTLAVQLCVKLSFLLFYLRFLNKTNFRYVVYGTMALVCMQVSGTVIMYSVQCRSAGAYIHPDPKVHTHCLKTGGASYYAPLGINLVIDIIIYTIPIWPLSRLQAPLIRRLGLIATMTLGFLPILLSALRILTMRKYALTTDHTWMLGRAIIATTIEFVAAFLTANMPAITSLFKTRGRREGYEMQPDCELRNRAPSNQKGVSAGLRGTLVNKLVPPVGVVREVEAVATRPPSVSESVEELFRESLKLDKRVSVMVTSKWEVSSYHTPSVHRIS